MAHELGKGIDEYLSTHSRLQHAAWCEFFLESGVWVRKDEADGENEGDDTDEYLQGGYPSSGDTHSPPERYAPDSDNPYGPEFFDEMKRRFYAQEHKKRTPREQFEIDKTKAAWAARLTPRNAK